MQAQQILVEDVKSDFIRQLEKLMEKKELTDSKDEQLKIQKRIESIQNSIKSIESIG